MALPMVPDLTANAELTRKVENPAKGFFRVGAPDGGYVDFPEGTDDATVNKVMTEVHGKVAEMRSTPVPATINPGDNPQDVTRPNISGNDAANFAKGTPEQQKAYMEFIGNDARYDPSQPPGSQENPVWLLGDAKPYPGLAHFDQKGVYHDGSDPAQPNQLLGAYEGVVRPLLNAGTWAVNGLGNVIGRDNAEAVDRGLNSLIGIHGTTDEARQHLNDQIAYRATQNERPGTLGGIAGGIVGTYPILAATKNPWLGGAAAGASQTQDPNNLTGTVRDAAMGAIGGKVADMGVRGLGSVISPRVNPMVQRLMNRKVELTPGEIIGGTPHRAEDAVRSIYGIGDMVIARQADAQRSFNIAATQSALDPIGVKLPEGIKAGFPAIQYAQRQLSDAYDRVVPALGARADTQFVQDIFTAQRAAQGLPKDEARVFDRFMRRTIMPMMQNGQISGETFKKIEEALGQRARTLRTGTATPFQRDLADIFDDTQLAFRDLVSRTNPQAAQAVQAINDGYANLVRVETAAQDAKGGVFTPDRLRQVVTSPRMAGRKMAARGQARMQEFADDGAQVMGQTIPDSGTVARALATGVAGTAVFGTGVLTHPLNVNPWAAAGLGVVAAPYSSRTANKIVGSILTRRPPGFVSARKGLDAAVNTGIVGSAGGQYPVQANRQQDLSQ